MDDRYERGRESEGAERRRGSGSEGKGERERMREREGGTEETDGWQIMYSLKSVVEFRTSVD